MSIHGKIKGKYKEFFKQAKKYAFCVSSTESYGKSGLKDNLKELVEDIEELFNLYKKFGMVPAKLKDIKTRLRALFEKYEKMAGDNGKLNSWNDTIDQAKLVRTYTEAVKDLWELKAASHGFNEKKFDGLWETANKNIHQGIKNAEHHRAYGG